MSCFITFLVHVGFQHNLPLKCFHMLPEVLQSSELFHFSSFLPGADLGFFVLQSKKNRTGRGQRRAWSAQDVVDAEGAK